MKLLESRVQIVASRMGAHQPLVRLLAGWLDSYGPFR
jgi:hypothetical protein